VDLGVGLRSGGRVSIPLPVHSSSFAPDRKNSDAPSFEMSPLVGAHTAPGGIWKGEAWESDMQGGGLVHQWLLAGWGKFFLSSIPVCRTALMAMMVPGVMIGEMWDLERLCEKSEELGRYTCFVSSMPLKVSCSLRPVAMHTGGQLTRSLRSRAVWPVHRTL